MRVGVEEGERGEGKERGKDGTFKGTVIVRG